VTEQEWLACDDPGPMLGFLRGRATDRKLRLFAVACYHHCRPFLPAEVLQAFLVVEQYADDMLGSEDVLHAFVAGGVPRDEADEVINNPHDYATSSARNCAGVIGIRVALRSLTRCLAGQTAGPEISVSKDAESMVQSSFLRDIMGNPFHPVSLARPILAWSDRLVVCLAQAIYDERRWGDMPILGDALLDAGCDKEEVLAHCRAGGEHVRGCWVVDLLLGKS
jgi:hypothetical protein